MVMSFLVHIHGWFCWWLKSCTTWDVWNPINNGIYYLSTGARFQPSTVSMLPCRIFARIHGEESGWCATGDLDPAFVRQQKFSGDNFLLHGLGGGKSIFWKKNKSSLLWGNDPIWRTYFWNGLKPPTRIFNISCTPLKFKSKMPLKNDGWKTSRSFKIGMVTFQGLHPWKFTKLKSGKSSEPSTSMTLRSMIIFQGVYVNVKLLGGKCRFSTFKRNSFDLVDVWMGGFNKRYRNEWMLGSNLCPSNFPHPQKCFKD